MKKLSLLIIVPFTLLAYEPAHSPDIDSVKPVPQMAIVPAVAIGAVVVGVAAWGGLKIFNAIVNVWEKHLTNNPAPGAGVVFTLPPAGPKSLQGSFDGEESGQ